jgi:hypothetical protein
MPTFLAMYWVKLILIRLGYAILAFSSLHIKIFILLPNINIVTFTIHWLSQKNRNFWNIKLLYVKLLIF